MEQLLKKFVKNYGTASVKNVPWVQDFSLRTDFSHGEFFDQL